MLERWITPSLFDGLKAWDEYNFCLELGNRKHEVLKQHRDAFITGRDFEWIAEQGFDAVRVPAGYWIFGGFEPYIGGIEYLDFAMETAGRRGLGVVIDLHSAPGSQNGFKHSGIEGKVEWHKSQSNMALTLKTIGKLAQRYKDSDNLIGIELLNEPRWDVPFDILADFYRKGYREVRKHCNERAAVIISDAFRPHDWQEALLSPAYKNVWLDIHLYQVFDSKYKGLDITGHLEKVKDEWAKTIEELQKRHPVMVGEWSLALPPRSLQGLTDKEKDRALSSYGEVQVATFSQSKMWFYFNYKTEQPSSWNARCMIEKGLLSIKRRVA